MRSSNCFFRQKPWFDRFEIPMAAGVSVLASSVLLLLVPSVGTVFMGVLAGFLLLTRAYVLRLRQQKATQLRLTLPTPGSRIRFRGSASLGEGTWRPHPDGSALVIRSRVGCEEIHPRRGRAQHRLFPRAFGPFRNTDDSNSARRRLDDRQRNDGILRQQWRHRQA
jgi:hypothetical protein